MSGTGAHSPAVFELHRDVIYGRGSCARGRFREAQFPGLLLGELEKQTWKNTSLSALRLLRNPAALPSPCAYTAAAEQVWSWTQERRRREGRRRGTTVPRDGNRLEP